MSETPRTDEVNKYLRIREEYAKTDNEIWVNHARTLERELNTAQQRIKRLEEAGDRMRLFCADPDDCFAWDKAKEVKL